MKKLSLFYGKAFWIFIISVLISFYVRYHVQPSLSVEATSLDVHSNSSGALYYTYKGDKKFLDKTLPYKESKIIQFQNSAAQGKSGSNPPDEEYVYREIDGKKVYSKLSSHLHWQFWSLLPAIVAVVLAWVSQEPISALLGGIISGAIILGKFDLTGAVLLPSLSTKSAASILVLYLWLLGALMGIWSKTGAALAFAELMTKKFVRGPRSAKLVAWFLGIIFFQGGTISTVLVGTTVKPIADKEKVSHEELAYIVDSTASPIASQLAFNAWPGYVQAFIFVSGVSFLATEADRINFFFKSVPFCFYAIFAVMGTFLLSIDRAPFVGRQMREAIDRSRLYGLLDSEHARPLAPTDMQPENKPEEYRASSLEFILPLLALIGIAIGTFITLGSPNVLWAFSFAVILSALIALVKGMPLRELIKGINMGWRGVVMGSVILLLAITIGQVSKDTGGGYYLVELLGDKMPYYLLPVFLQIITILIAFSTGTSWGTYAVAFPLAMPLAWGIAQANGLAHPEFFMTISFAAVMDGSVYGDQCSPISDTTVLSSMCTGCDLMDHVRTQIPQASIAALLAGIGWTAITFFFA